MYRLIILAITVLCLVACDKDDPITFPTTFNEGLFFVNEGQFNNANASLSYYDTVKDTIFNMAYEAVNNQPIGDVLQSIVFDAENLYLVVNNSGKIIVADKKTLVYKGEIGGLPSPRYMEYSGIDDLWYVSNLYNDSLFVVNTANFMIDRAEYIGASVEAMKTLDNKLYLSSTSSDYLYVKDLSTNSLDSILVAYGGNSLIVDNNNKLWLLCNGNFYTPGTAALHQIDTDDKEVEITFGLPMGFPSKLTYNLQNNTIYFLNTNVYALNLDNPSNKADLFIESSGESFYGLNTINNQIFVTDAIDFTQNGLVYEYDTDGELIKTSTAGINPNAVVVVPN